jgi:ribosome-associated protein
MADIALNNSEAGLAPVPMISEAALSIAKTIALHNGEDVVVLDLSVHSGWTDRFVIATATSSAHLRGLERFIDEEAARLGFDRLHKKSLADDDEWLLVDLGPIVVHVMTHAARSFYELEKLWFQAPATTVSPLSLSETREDHSSKSS